MTSITYEGTRAAVGNFMDIRNGSWQKISWNRQPRNGEQPLIPLPISLLFRIKITGYGG